MLHPDPSLVARLGPRPDGGAQRRSWDRAVGAVAVYRARWGATPVSGGPTASWALGPAPVAGDAVAYYNVAAEALELAERNGLAARLTAELAHERRRLHRALAPAPPPTHYDEVADAVGHARRQLLAAEAKHARTTQRLEELTRVRRWRRNPQGIEMARQSVQVAGQRCARAALDLDRAEARAAALQDQAPAQDLVRQRLEVVQAALTAQVEAAVSTPAPYLTAALGEAPEDSTKPTAWREAAVRIESYRHAELGCSPTDGPVADDTGAIGAIGPRPQDYLGSLQWDYAAELLAPAVEPELEPPGLDLGP